MTSKMVEEHVGVSTSRHMLLMDPNVQLLLNHLLSRDKAELIPDFDAKYGPRFVEVEMIIQETPAGAREFLEKLAHAKVLERRFHEKYTVCPVCRSPDVPVKYKCPNCKSFEIQQKSLLEHVACGMIGKDEVFKKGDRQVCPRCNREFLESGLSIRQVGTWFDCRLCGKAFDLPISEHVCRTCKHNFTVEAGVLLDSFSYGILKDAEKEFREGSMFLKPLKDVLESADFSVKIPGLLRGTSGTDHSFALTASRKFAGKEEILVMDVVSSDGLADENPVIAMFAKRYDINPDRSILVAIPGIRNGAKRLASLYRIDLVEATSASEATEKLRALVE